MKKFKVTCMKDNRLQIGKPNLMQITEQTITTDGTEFNYDLPPGFLIMQIIEILPDLHIISPKKTISKAN